MLADFAGMINVDVTFGYGGGGGGSRRVTSSTSTTTTTTADTGSVLGEKIVFADIATHWAEEYISDLADVGVVEGRSEGKYEPNEYLTRGEAVKIALGILGIEVDYALTSSFDDVAYGSWYAPYVATAEQHGLIQGYDDGTFKPGSNINRAEIMKIFLEGKDLDLTASAEADFSDVEKDAWYTPYFSFAAENGIIEGYTDGTVRPGNNIYRGEMAKIASLVMDL
ncbi:S-layer homology domain-containing protein [Patescibacteria group bacterium]